MAAVSSSLSENVNITSRCLVDVSAFLLLACKQMLDLEGHNKRKKKISAFDFSE